jgi:protein-L-isoaspartate(D-aspartate) O-methyltransferase
MDNITNLQLNGLVENLVGAGYLKTPRIIDALKKIRRVDFLPGYLKQENTNIESLAELNEALPIGHGQTISQPAVVAFMLELLEAKPGHKVLDIGFGSGWTTALLAQIVGPKGHVAAIERISELCDFGKENIDNYDFIKMGIVDAVCGDGSAGLAGGAPYDRILASAAAEKLPRAWLDQLAPGGILVAPTGNSIKKFKKDRQGKISQESFEGFVFVPLVQTE